MNSKGATRGRLHAEGTRLRGARCLAWLAGQTTFRLLSFTLLKDTRLFASEVRLTREHLHWIPLSTKELCLTHLEEMAPRSVWVSIFLFPKLVVVVCGVYCGGRGMLVRQRRMEVTFHQIAGEWQFHPKRHIRIMYGFYCRKTSGVAAC